MEKKTYSVPETEVQNFFINHQLLDGSVQSVQSSSSTLKFGGGSNEEARSKDRGDGDIDWDLDF